MSSLTALLPPQKVLPILAAAGTFLLWGAAFLDGTLFLILKAVFSSEHQLPGTDSLLKRSLTGIRWPFDFLLNILVVFFWEAVDGSHPTSCALGLYFVAQYIPVLTMLYTSGFRAGNKGVGTTKWLLAFQACGIGSVGPLWALSYLQQTPLLSTTRLTQLRSLSVPSSTSLIALPLSIAIGYLVPVILMCLRSPTFVSNAFQQKAIALWNVFPIWVLCVQQLLEPLVKKLTDRLERLAPEYARLVSSATVMRVVNSIAVIAGFISHAGFLGFALLVAVFPDIFSPGFAANFTFGKLFIPPLPLLTAARSATVGDGVRSFFMWDMFFGFSLAILVAIWEFEAVARARSSQLRLLQTCGAMLLSVAVFGPGTTALLISWARDELLFDTVPDQSGSGSVSNGHVKAPGIVA